MPKPWYKSRLYTSTHVAMIDADQRRLLGEFIRAHRERLRPDAPATRRRTPGLRREELAARADISPTWCTWLEQGRPVRASPETLARLADALVLSAAERTYLFRLAGRLDPRAASAAASEAPEALLAIVSTLAQPAYGLDSLWNACCWNAAASHLFRGWLDGDHDRNLLRFVFLDAAARKLIPDWEDRARRLLAEFRADYSRSFRDTRVSELVSSLRSLSSLFATAWEAQAVHYRAGGPRAFLVPDGGVVHYVQHTFVPVERTDYKLVVLVPVPSP
jgi:transcriptional regulator with XRE-family HTH domain